MFPGVDSPVFSPIVPSKNRPFSLGLWRFSIKKDPWKEWTWKVPLERLSAFCRLDPPQVAFNLWLPLKTTPEEAASSLHMAMLFALAARFFPPDA